MKTQILTSWADPSGPIGYHANLIDGYPVKQSDVTNQLCTYIAVAKHDYVVEADLTEAQLSAIQADADYVVLHVGDNPAAMTPAELDAMRTKLANHYNLDVVDLTTLNTNDPAAITTNLKNVARHEPWKAGLAVQVGQVYLYDKNLYEVIQAHTTQSDWTPPVAHALFKRYYEPSDRPWPWVQPTGAHDAYPVGARVTHGGNTWSNAIAANVWEPGVTGWVNLTPPPATPDWAYPVAYKVNDLVVYQGSNYRCLQAHTSQAGWTPPVVPALWAKV